MKPKICVIGSYVCQMSACLPRQPFPGETIVASEFDMGPGGKGNNVAIAASRLGAEVVLIERIGDDMFGEMALDIYEKENIDTNHVRKTQDEHSGTGLVYIQPDGENTAAYFPGANEKLTAEDVYDARERIKGAAIMYIQLEVPDDPILAAIDIAREFSMKVVLNPAPARKMSPKIMDGVDVLTPNQVEAMALTSKAFTGDLSESEIQEIAKALSDKGPSEVFITLGSKGACYIDPAGNTMFQPSIKVEAVDTVGAGDSFNAALCVALANGLEKEEVLLRACINGALATTKLGVVDALPSIEDVETLFESQSKGRNR